MNAFVRMVLIPENEYQKLKQNNINEKIDIITQTLKSPSSNLLKQSSIGRVLNQKSRDQVINFNPEQLPTKVRNELLAEHRKMKKEEPKVVVKYEPDEANDEDSSYDNYESFQPTRASTPELLPKTEKSTLRAQLSGLINSNDEIMSDDGQPIPASNIRDIKKYFNDPDLKKKRKPLGYKKVITKLSKRPKIDIKNKQVRKEIEILRQMGSGAKLWSSLRKF